MITRNHRIAARVDWPGRTQANHPLPLEPTGSGGGLSMTLAFDYSSATTAPPTSNQIRFNALHPYTAVTTLWIRTVTTDGRDVRTFLGLIPVGSTVYVQDRNDHTLFARFTTTAATVDQTTYVEVPVAWHSNGGALLNNQAVEVLVITGGGGGGAPAAHHATHEPGGADAIVNLDAGILTSGTVPDARFPAILPAVSGANLTNLPAGGSTTQVQFNDGGVFGGSAGLTFDKTTSLLTLGGNVLFTADTTLYRNTAPGSDTGRVSLTGAGSAGPDISRGAYLSVYGNQASNPGTIFVGIGNVAGAVYAVVGSAGMPMQQMQGNDGSAVFTSSNQSATTWTFNGSAGNGGAVCIQRAGVARGYLGTGINIIGGTSNDALALGATSTLHLGAGGPSPVYTVDLDSSGFYPHSTNQLPCGKVGQLWTAVYATNGTIQTSDRRRKTDIRDSDLGLSFIERLRPVRYHWRDGDTARPQYGLIAQDLLALGVGEAFVHGSEAEGYGTTYASFTAPLIAAVQELARRLTALEGSPPDGDV